MTYSETKDLAELVHFYETLEEIVQKLYKNIKDRELLYQLALTHAQAGLIVKHLTGENF